MKKQKLLTTMLLLFALIVGSSSAWADVTDELVGSTLDVLNTSKASVTYTDFSGISVTSSAVYAGQAADGSTKSDQTSKFIQLRSTSPAGIVTTASGGKIKSIKVEWNSTTSDTRVLKVYGKNLPYSASSDLYSDQSATKGTEIASFTKSDGTKTITITGDYEYIGIRSNSGAMYIDKITIVWSSGFEITALSNNNEWGTVAVSANTITATPSTGYRVVAGDGGYTVTSGTATVTNNGDNTFSVSASTDCTIQINFEAIPTHAVTFSNPTGGTVTVKNGDDAIVSGDEIREGTELTLIASPGPGKKFTSWTVTGATPADDSAATTTLTVGTSDISIAANLGDATTHPIHWSVNGSVEETSDVIEGEAIVFPSSISGIPSGYTLKGWSATEIITPQTTAPSYVEEATCTEEKTYYAVFARGVASSASLTKMGTGDTFAANDKIVVVAVIDEDTSYGLYQETISSSYVKNFEFDGEVSTIAADNKNWWTVSAGSTSGTWKLGDSTNGFLYNGSSNNLTADKDNSSDWTLTDNEDGSFKLAHSRYLSCRSDLTNDNKYKFRMAGGTPAGVYSLDIYKYIPAGTVDTDYRTKLTYATATITAAEYATFVSPYATDFSTTGITVYTAKDNTTYVKLNEVAGRQVPANTPVVLYKEGADGSAIDVPVIASASAVESNDLEVSDGTNAKGDGIYVLSKKSKGVGFYPWVSDSSLSAGKVFLRASSGAREFIGFDGETTGISQVDNLQVTVDSYYNLAGQRIAQPSKGLYIVNGKKVVIK